MNAAKLLILENSLGQKVRTFAVQSNAIHIVYLKDSRRVEAFSDLSVLDDNEISYALIKSIQVNEMTDSVDLVGLGRLRLNSDNAVNSPSYNLPEEDDDKTLIAALKKASVGHAAAIVLLLLSSWVYTSFINKAPEQPLVTIVIPKKETPAPIKQKVETVKAAQKKITPTVKKVAKVATPKKPTPKVVNKTVPPRPTQQVAKTQPAVRQAPTKDIRRVGALAALGGVAKGSKSAEGLDMNSLKNIRAAGTGNGGGGIGTTGRGGAKGYLPGNGLIAGSAGEGARAQGAGGYGTRGSGGGKAGYGKISMVGGTSATSLPLNEEVTVEGGLDQDQIIAVINRNKGQITYCYEQGLRAQPTIGGRVAVSFIIGPNGKISKANVAESSLGSRTVENCMIARMKTWQFPRPVGAVSVDVLYPFELTRVSAR
ncbi:hypothetical protein BDW_05615 [Bdellovibrio bacteriovorus W]|nr:hypothetical protein BDW_05615 [Bdellovibrio bacteriovorus W]